MRITKENLTRYDQHFKSWQRRRLGYGKALENWHQTEEAGAVQFYPVGGSSLEGKVKFSFKETPPTSGDKGPSNPGAIAGVSAVQIEKRTKNLVRLNDGAYLANGVSRLSDGTIILNGTVSAGSLDYRYAFNKPIPLGSYTLSFNNPVANSSIRASFRSSGTGWGSDSMTGRDGYLDDVNKVRSVNISSFTSTAGVYAPNSLIRVSWSAGEFSNFSFKLQLEQGDTATEYDSDQHELSTIPLGSTYYGGEIDLATGLMTVTHAAVTPDASTVDISSAPAFLPLDNADTYGRMITSVDGTSLSVGSAGGTVVYKLATPYTVQLDPVTLAALAQTSRHEPRLNTVYTDADSIQIAYQKSPSRVSIEQEQAILSLGGNV